MKRESGDENGLRWRDGGLVEVRALPPLLAPLQMELMLEGAGQMQEKENSGRYGDEKRRKRWTGSRREQKY